MNVIKKNRQYGRNLGKNTRYYNVSTSMLQERKEAREATKDNRIFRISFFDNVSDLFGGKTSDGKQFLYVGYDDTKLYFYGCDDGEGWAVNHPSGKGSYATCTFTLKKKHIKGMEQFANGHFELFHDEENNLYFIDSKLKF